MNLQPPVLDGIPVLPHWTRQLVERMRYQPLLKAAGTTAFITLFFIAYFHILRHPVFAVREMPLTVVDRNVAFYPPALVAYASLWFYVGIPPGLLLSVRELVRYGVWIGGLCCAGLLCFILWPTAIPSQQLDAAGFPGFGILAGIDAKANACPSLHVATAVFSAIWLDRLLREMGAGWLPRWGNWVWFIAITYSTLAIRQHVALDALGGMTLGIPLALLSLRRHGQPGYNAPIALPLGLGETGLP